jgi:MoaA/NifB/PqqE/SkfB family radical SAM enzyme
MKPAIEVTSNCNNNCKFCPYRLDGNPDGGFMSWEDFTKIFDAISNQSEAVMLFNRGEPFLHPRIYDMIRYAQYSNNVILSTNGVLVDVDKLYSVFTHGTLCVSIPGVGETYKLMTGKDSYEIVKNKVIELEKKKPEGVELYVKMVRQPENEDQEKELQKFCKMVHVVEDSNQPNTNNYTECGQPKTTPTWRWDGTRSVCCRSEEDYTPENYELGKKRSLKSCQNCNIC